MLLSHTSRLVKLTSVLLLGLVAVVVLYNLYQPVSVAMAAGEEALQAAASGSSSWCA